jgi:hypothetical protein
VQPLPIRREQPLDDAVVVVRAGVMDRQSLERAARQCFDGYGVLAVSVEAVIGKTVDQACRTSPRLSQYRQVRLSSIGRLIQGPFVLLPTFEAPHFSLILPDLSDLTVPRLVRCFDDPIPNPGLDPSR